MHDDDVLQDFVNAYTWKNQVTAELSLAEPVLQEKFFSGTPYNHEHRVADSDLRLIVSNGCTHFRSTTEANSDSGVCWISSLHCSAWLSHVHCVGNRDYC